ncbi:hypothetical protein Ahia01_001065000 [Argonauta hians]
MQCYWSFLFVLVCVAGLQLSVAQVSEATVDTEDSTNHDMTEKSMTSGNKSEILTSSPKLDTGVKADPEARPDNETSTQRGGAETAYHSSTLITVSTIAALTVASAVAISDRF